MGEVRSVAVAPVGVPADSAEVGWNILDVEMFIETVAGSTWERGAVTSAWWRGVLLEAKKNVKRKQAMFLFVMVHFTYSRAVRAST